ncbi:MAG: zinc-dependent metalloprotease [Aestuariivirga sp.]|nr:zinc-dependent metalloprotease [Aestuariivirga sp.]
MRAALLIALLAVIGQPARAQDPAASPAEALLAGAELVGSGPISVYEKKGSVILSLPRAVFDRPFIWYAEVVSLPPGAVSDGLEAGRLLARIERHGNLVIVRDLTARAVRTGGDGLPQDAPPDPERIPGSPDPDPFPERPIDVALNTLQSGPAVASFPVAAETADGSVLVDATQVFSNDVASLTARDFVFLTGMVPAAVDPARSYVERVRTTPQSLNIRSHLTFLASNAQNPVTGVRPVSIVIGHSFIFLPETPMAWRRADPRIGYFTATFTDYESRTGNLVVGRNVITRYRLEKKNKDQAVSDPVKPIVFYIGPGVPDRWRPYLKAGVELWNPAFEKAGFSNALVALDAPTPAQDPNWSVEDISQNVIRWVTTERVNAYGPHVVDPRSGEILSAHILIWPSVLDYFSKYYFALFGTVDPEAATLPFSTDKLGRLLTYIVAHEVGHALGLRHNHIASTAYSVEDMRNAELANARGPNSSIMAYGRFNQVAQPGDGITQFWAKLGPYDFAAIAWGYGDFGGGATEEKALAERAKVFETDRALFWAAGEMVNEIKDYAHDPRVQKENTGAERIDATRLGVANIQRTLTRLDQATGGDDQLFAQTAAVMISTQKGMLDSVSSLVGGAMPRFGAAGGPRLDLVPVDEQSAAVFYLLGEGARSLEPFAEPAVIDRLSVTGGEHAVADMQAHLLIGLLNGSRLAVLEAQSRRGGYSPVTFGHDVSLAVWGNLEEATPTDRALQRAYVMQTRQLIDGWTNAAAKEESETKAAVAAGFPAGFAAVESDTGDDTAYPAWLRQHLPQLKARLDEAGRQAGSEDDRLHFGQMALEVQRLMQRLQ